MRDWPEPGAEDRREDVSPFSQPNPAHMFTAGSALFSAPEDNAPMSTDYADGLAEGYAAGLRAGRERSRTERAARWARWRRIAWEGATYGAAYMLGTSLAELVARRRAVRS